MNLEIAYLKKADKFFEENSAILSKEEARKLIIKGVERVIGRDGVNIDLKRLKGNLKEYFRIRQGKVRILFKVEKNQVLIKAIVYDIDFRGDIY